MSRFDRHAPYFSIGIQIGGLALGLLCNAVLARTLGSGGYGVYSVATMIVSIVGLPLEVGLAMVMVREIARYRSDGDWSRMRGAVNASFVIAIAFSAFWLVGCATALLGGIGTLAAYPSVAFWSALLLPMASLAAVRGSVLRGLGHPLWGQVLGAILRPGIFLLFLSVAAFLAWRESGSYEISVSYALALHVAGAAVAFGCGLFLLRRLLPSDLDQSSATYEWRRWLSEIPSFTLMAAVMAVNQAIGSLLLAYYGYPELVGIYRVAELGASLVAMPLGALAIHYSAAIAQQMRDGCVDTLRETLRRGALIALIVATPVGLVFIVFGREIIRFGFGAAYEAAAAPLFVLVLGQLANTLAGLVGIVMSMGGRHRESIIAVSIAIAVQSVLVVILVPKYLIMGTAVASALATLVWSQILRIRVKQLFRVSTLPA